MPINTIKTGAAIAARRQRMNLSQQGLAGLMNVTHQAVSKWEKGIALPDTETLLALAKLFDTSMEDLLMGVLPVEETLEPEDILFEEPVAKAPPAPESLDFGAVMSMLPFASVNTADQVFRTFFHATAPDAGQLSAIAPFVSPHALDECINEHPLTDYSPEIVISLAPFLSVQTVDKLIKGLKAPIPSEYMYALMPFASPKTVDEMVMDTLPASLVNTQRKIDTLNQKLAAERKAVKASKRESPRVRILRKAIERKDMTLIDEMSSSLPELVSVMNADDQKQLCILLMENGMYNLLAEVIEERDEDIVHDLLDKAFEMDDLELVHLIGEHI